MKLSGASRRPDHRARDEVARLKILGRIAARAIDGPGHGLGGLVPVVVAFEDAQQRMGFALDQQAHLLARLQRR